MFNLGGAAMGASVGSAPAAAVKKNSGARSSKYSKKEIARLLEDYTLVPPAMWTQLKGRHCRYVRRQDNKFVRGGFVVGYQRAASSDLITFTNNLNRGAKGRAVWSIALGAIKHLYVKGELPITAPSTPTTPAVPAASNDKQILALIKRVAALEARMAAMEQH